MIESWGRAHRLKHQVSCLNWRDELDLSTLAGAAANGHVLPYGMGRSYGDSCLNGDGTLIQTGRLDRFLAADWTRGVVKAEAGLTLDSLMQLSVPKGWFPMIVPGTKFVSLGGAVANDIHGKNHHLSGSFGASVQALGLLRSDGTRLSLSRSENQELFSLTIGGLGLTGLIEWVELKMLPISSSELEIQTFRLDHLDAFFEHSDDSADWPYTVAWVDCFAPSRALGRGLFSRGRFAENGALLAHRNRRVTVPLEMPSIALNRYSMTAFNQLYWRLSKTGTSMRDGYDRFFFPLDTIGRWNRIYGKRGFYQHQSLLPPDDARSGLRALLEEIRQSGQGSFLAVLKNYGPEQSPGTLSFAGEGCSLALDFANTGRTTLELLERLDAIVAKFGGRLYPAKDGRMSGAFFRASYPQWVELEAARDPLFSSTFWRRVTPAH